MTNKLDNIIAWISGDVLAFIFTWELLERLGWNVFAAILTGFFGGVAGILGKIFVNWIFKKLDK